MEDKCNSHSFEFETQKLLSSGKMLVIAEMALDLTELPKTEPIHPMILYSV